MTKAQKEALAQVLIRGAVDALNALEEEPESFPKAERELVLKLSQEEMYAQAARWLRKLPGNGWDNRLPQV